MFGYVQANLNDLDAEEKKRYQAVYCGLCRTIGHEHGLLSRLSLTYDMVFLTLLLSSLYEPEEEYGKCRCCAHPCRTREYACNSCTSYAGAMTIALAYYKCLDDWNDDRSFSRKCYAGVLKKQYAQVKDTWPKQCAVMEESLSKLLQLERERSDNPDAAANCFGGLMAGIFVWRTD